MANENTNVTTQTGAGQELSPELKTFYDKNLIRIAKPNLVHRQVGQKRNIPKNGGKSIEFRSFNPLPKALKPITEGVTPDGNRLDVRKVEATVNQYGDYIVSSDVLELTAIDNIITETQEILGDQAGRTLDTITREVLNSGTNVQYGKGDKKARHTLVGGEESGNDYLSVYAVERAATTLKNGNAKYIAGDFFGIIHPDCALDIRQDPRWQAVTTYNPKDFYEGEVGKIGKVRFVESTEAKKFHAEDLCAAARELTVASVSGKVITLKETITADDAAKLAQREILIGSGKYTVASATTGSITVVEELASDATANAIIYPGEAGAKGRDVYSTLIIAENAYGVTDVEGGGLETIIKPRGSGGTEDPLNQRSSIGWKALDAAEILTESFLVRIEATSSSDVMGAN